ncbi:MAG: AEC family transporter [Oscillospiraceae bacterium]|jgi:predicted permease|nr:AEC family transporter [Oscillospiraceae bacterium]
MHDFFSNTLLALRQVVMLYGIVAIGFAAERIHWFPEETARRCTQLLLYVITPCVILKSFFVMENTAEARHGLVVALGAGVLLHAAGILMSEPFFRGKNPAATDPILHYGAIYGNCGYMALPLAEAMAGSNGVFFGSVVILTFQVFSFSHGEFVMAGGVVRRKSVARVLGDPLQICPDEAGALRQAVKFDWKKLFLNAGVLAVAVGLPLFMLKIPVPEVVRTPVQSVAAMNSPLAMLMFGAYLSRTDFGRTAALLRNKKFYAALLIKLFGIPLAVLALLLLLGARGPLLKAVMISATAPCANNTVIFAAKHGRDAGFAALTVGIVSILSILTMPLMIAIGLSLSR